MKEEIDENKEKEVIQKAYKYNGLLGIWIIAVFISFLLQVAKIITDNIRENLNIESMDLAFTVFEKEKYYENGEHF